jgi:Domain of unknown function (DUF4124)
MQRIPFLTVALIVGATLALPASAQWKWRDKNGVVQYSDLPPPPGIPQQDVLQRSNTGRQGISPSAPPAPPAASAVAKGVDSELEAKRRKAELEKTDKTNAEQRAQAEKVAAAKAENCTRAKGHMKSLEEGLRMVRTNAKGEREVLDDKTRAEEKARTREIISSDCQ